MLRTATLFSLLSVLGFASSCATSSDSPYSKAEIAAAMAEASTTTTVEQPVEARPASDSAAAVMAEVESESGMMSLVPKARDRVPEKTTIVLLAGRKTKITCDGKLVYAFLGSDSVVKDPDQDGEPGLKLTGECGLILEPAIEKGFTNLMLKDSRTVYHRNIEIRSPTSRDYKNALKYYKAEVKLSDE